MATFSGSGSDLASLIAYERDALEFVRSTLFGQTEATSQSLNLNLSDAKDEDGFYPEHHRMVALGISIGTEAVRSALSRLRPLAFAAAFKMQDMIVEWILHANGSREWSFRKKIAEYEAGVSAATLCEPPALANRNAVSKAFWGLYKALTPFRNKIIHESSFSVANDALAISAEGRTLHLSHEEQGSYIRAICLIADALVSGKEIEGTLGYTIENDLHGLSAIHNEMGLSAQAVRLASVSVVAPGQKGANGRIEASINFDDIRRQAERVFPVSGILLFDLTLLVESNEGQLRWMFPATTAPTGEARVVEGDPKFEPYRTSP